MNPIIKIIFFILLGVVSIISCKDVDPKSFHPETGIISFSSSTLEASNALDTLWIDVESNLPFRLKTTSSWLSFVKPNGFSSEKVGIIVARNREQGLRSGIVEAYITDGVFAQLQISQAAGDPIPDYTRHFYVKTDAYDTGDGLSWENAITLDQALEEAVSGDVIHVAAGIYRPSKMLTGGTTTKDATFEIVENVQIVGGYPAQASEGAISDPLVHITELNGNNEVTHVVTVLAPQDPVQQVKLSGLTITKGMAGGTGNVNAGGVTVSRQHGGGLFVSNSKLVMEQCSIIDNGSANHAAGIFITRSANVTMNRVSIKDNYSTIPASNGGGIWNDGSRLVIYDSEITGNRVGGVGAGLYSLNTAIESVNILYNVTISKNVSGIFGNNSVGGGIYARERSVFYIVNSTIYGNKAGGTSFGGGVALYGATTFHLINSTISANEAGEKATAAGGAGIHNASANNNKLHIYNSIVSGNGENNATDIGGQSTYVAYSIQSSILGNQVYDSGEKLTSATFDPSTGFSVFGVNGSFLETLPLRGVSAATTDGMSVLELEILANNLQDIDGQRLLYDQNNVSRQNKEVMGADVTVK